MGGLKVLKILTERPGIHGLPEDPKLDSYPPFVKHNFPRWYAKAVAEGHLPVFPPKANPKWYMQPDLAPAPYPKEPAWADEFEGSKFGKWTPILGGWLGVGVLGTLSGLFWTLRRRNNLEGKEEQTRKP